MLAQERLPGLPADLHKIFPQPAHLIHQPFIQPRLIGFFPESQRFEQGQQQGLREGIVQPAEEGQQVGKARGQLITQCLKNIRQLAADPLTLEVQFTDHIAAGILQQGAVKGFQHEADKLRLPGRFNIKLIGDQAGGDGVGVQHLCHQLLGFPHRAFAERNLVKIGDGARTAKFPRATGNETYRKLL